jgi:purine nucleosidase
VTLCLLGPHTNLALAMVKAPDIVPRIREIVLMGGAVFEGGNSTPSAEFNILVDPHAADVVFKSGVPITVMPLDVSHKALTTKARIDRIRALGTRVSDAVAKMLEFFERYDEQKYGTDGAPLHDPCVISFLVQPGLFQGRTVNVAIETASPLTLGMTVTDWWKVTDRAPNAMVMTQVDAEAYYALLTERLARL